VREKGDVQYRDSFILLLSHNNKEGRGGEGERKRGERMIQDEPIPIPRGPVRLLSERFRCSYRGGIKRKKGKEQGGNHWITLTARSTISHLRNESKGHSSSAHNEKKKKKKEEKEGCF